MTNGWIEHRRSPDGEPLGWMLPVDEDFIAIDLLGRERTGPVDWLTAEETLEDLGIGYLADPYELRLPDGQWLRVRLSEVSVDGIKVKKDDWSVNDINAEQLFYEVGFPMPPELRQI